MGWGRHIKELRRLWNSLPVDGRGLIAPTDPIARHLVALATEKRLSIIPRAIRPIAVWLLRTLWLVKAPLLVLEGLRNFGFSASDTLRFYGDACLYGMRPKDAFGWRKTMSKLPPLSTQAFWKIASAVGASEQRDILVDKLKTANALEQLTVKTPELLSIIPCGTTAHTLPETNEMFVKPRHGRRGIDAFSISRLEAGGYWVDGARRNESYVTARLAAAAVSDALLVQRRLIGVAELADLDTIDGRPPVLRILTAREPESDPYLNAALLWIGVPGEVPSHPLRDALRVPVAVATGRLLAGYWLGAPKERFQHSAWHQAQLAGRMLPGFDAAADACVKAARAFPGLPLIGWDVILTDDGPVILEGNSANDLLFVTWMEEGAPHAPPLLPLFERWATNRLGV